MDTTQIAYYLVAQSWIAALIIELDVDPPRQAKREVRALLKRWPKGTPPSAQASTEIIDITDYTIAA